MQAHVSVSTVRGSSSPVVVHVCPSVGAAVTLSLLNTVAASIFNSDQVTVLVCSFGMFDAPQTAFTPHKYTDTYIGACVHVHTHYV